MSKYVFDLDGTICTQQKSGEYHLAVPIVHMVNIVNYLYDQGHEITIWTARGMNSCNGDIDEVMRLHWNSTWQWLVDNGVKFHKLRLGKPPADFYVDDKSVTLSQIRSWVKPWKKDECTCSLDESDEMTRHAPLCAVTLAGKNW